MVSYGNRTLAPAELCPKQVSDAPSAAFEKYYTVGELAEIWGLSERTIRRMFSHEPGVIKWENGETRCKKSYTTLRIPESVVQRVHRTPLTHAVVSAAPAASSRSALRKQWRNQRSTTIIQSKIEDFLRFWAVRCANLGFIPPPGRTALLSSSNAGS